MQQSDKLLKEVSKTGFDRTVINKSSSEPVKQEVSPGKEIENSNELKQESCFC